MEAEFEKRFAKSLPFEGAWVEIGRKYKQTFCIAVAPTKGAWVEIYLRRDTLHQLQSLPFEGARIEIHIHNGVGRKESLPFEGCGLKFLSKVLYKLFLRSLPIVGARIETYNRLTGRCRVCRSIRKRVRIEIAHFLIFFVGHFLFRKCGLKWTWQPEQAGKSDCPPSITF